MTCVWRTRPPETTKVDAFRPSIALIERVKVSFFDDDFEGFEELMLRRVFLDRDDVHILGLNMISHIIT